MKKCFNKIRELFQEYGIKIPDEYIDEFKLGVYKENLSRLVFSAVMVLIAESLIYHFFNDRIFRTDSVVISIIIINIISLPVFYISWKKHEVYNITFLASIHFLYLTIMLFCGCALSLIPQNEFVSINAYTMVAFAVASVVYTPPIQSMIIFLTVYLTFYFLLPYYQLNNDIVLVLRINTLLMNIMAWILSRFVYRMKFALFIDHKIIENKNLILKDMLSRDSMTSLLNHDNMYIKLNEEIERAERIQYPLSVIMMDIDDFKNINDLYGHQVGDKVIIKIAQILSDTCRSTDSICRYGGEEFAVIMPDTNLTDAGLLAERIRTNINETEFINGLHITLSGGISKFTGETAEELIACADLYLYSAKSKGKNRFEMAKRDEIVTRHQADCLFDDI